MPQGTLCSGDSIGQLELIEIYEHMSKASSARRMQAEDAKKAAYELDAAAKTKPASSKGSAKPGRLNRQQSSLAVGGVVEGVRAALLDGGAANNSKHTPGSSPTSVTGTGNQRVNVIAGAFAKQLFKSPLKEGSTGTPPGNAPAAKLRPRGLASGSQLTTASTAAGGIEGGQDEAGDEGADSVSKTWRAAEAAAKAVRRRYTCVADTGTFCIEIPSDVFEAAVLEQDGVLDCTY